MAKPGAGSGINKPRKPPQATTPLVKPPTGPRRPPSHQGRPTPSRPGTVPSVPQLPGAPGGFKPNGPILAPSAAPGSHGGRPQPGGMWSPRPKPPPRGGSFGPRGSVKPRVAQAFPRGAGGKPGSGIANIPLKPGANVGVQPRPSLPSTLPEVGPITPDIPGYQFDPSPVAPSVPSSYQDSGGYSPGPGVPGSVLSEPFATNGELAPEEYYEEEGYTNAQKAGAVAVGLAILGGIAYAMRGKKKKRGAS